MRILVLTTLYPNAEMPGHGVFVENRLRAYLKKYDADVRVIAPVPWFPSRNDTFGRYADYARVAHREKRGGVTIFHPKYFIPPKLGMNYAAISLARCFRRTIDELTADGWDYDFIDAHYFYPDGAAACEIARELGKPIVITGRGSDLTLLPSFEGPRKKILDAALKADALVTVSNSLKDKLEDLGVPKGKTAVLRNGVDLDLFNPVGRDEIRKMLNLSGTVLLSVGHLIDRKGHDLVIRALKDLPDATLLIVGEGEKRRKLEALTKSCGVSKRVRFMGAVAHEKMSDVYKAADALVLASSREGWPNVLLEAMACGTPCIVSDAGGNREVICDKAAGVFLEARTPAAIVESINALLANKPDRAKTRAYAENFSWENTADGMHEIFTGLAAKAKAKSTIKPLPLRQVEKKFKPKLIVTVDTEESFDWSDLDNTEIDCCDTADVDRFQDSCAEMGIEPLYFLTYPLLKDREIAAYFRGLKEAGDAECGLHLHQWSTPPGELNGAYYSYQSNLPRDLHRQKLEVLAAAYEEAFGDRALTHRAGRYGLTESDYSLLATIGVTFDFSPSAGFDFTNEGGPDFTATSSKPFIANGNAERVMVTPVSGARALNKTRFFVNGKTPRAHTTPMRLSPEGASLDDMKALTKRLVAEKTPVMTFTLHSTSFTKGGNPYAQSADDVEAMLETSRAYFDWFRKKAGGEIISFRELKETYEAFTNNQK